MDPTESAAGIEVAALDPCRGYGAALSAGLPNALRVLDPFHVVRLGFACVEDVRRRVQQPPTAIAAAAVTHCMHPPGTAPRGQVAAALVAAQELRAIYRCRDRNQAAQRLHHWTVMCIDPGVPEIGRRARTMTTWRDEFLAYFSTGRINNGPTEAINLLIKEILRVGHGFRNSTTTAYACCCSVESRGTITPQHHYEADYHAWPRGA
jgi:transposase